MERLKWNAHLATGDRSIDLQHQELIDMINELAEALDGANTAALPGVLQRLNNYVLFHFSHEESLMRSHGLDADYVKVHLQQHTEFTDRIASSLSAIGSGNPGDNAKFLALHDYLSQWLPNHIMQTDKGLARLLKAPVPPIRKF